MLQWEKPSKCRLIFIIFLYVLLTPFDILRFLWKSIDFSYFWNELKYSFKDFLTIIKDEIELIKREK